MVAYPFFVKKSVQKHFILLLHEVLTLSRSEHGIVSATSHDYLPSLLRAGAVPFARVVLHPVVVGRPRGPPRGGGGLLLLVDVGIPRTSTTMARQSRPPTRLPLDDGCATVFVDEFGESGIGGEASSSRA